MAGVAGRCVSFAVVVLTFVSGQARAFCVFDKSAGSPVVATQIELGAESAVDVRYWSRFRDYLNARRDDSPASATLRLDGDTEVFTVLRPVTSPGGWLDVVAKLDRTDAEAAERQRSAMLAADPGPFDVTIEPEGRACCSPRDRKCNPTRSPDALTVLTVKVAERWCVSADDARTLFLIPAAGWLEVGERTQQLVVTTFDQDGATLASFWCINTAEKEDECEDDD